MKKRLASAGAVALAAIALPVLGAAPASAACTTQIKFAGISISNSTKFDASSACDNVWGVRTAQLSDPIRGRFYKDGSWETSSYGWQFVHTNGAGGPARIVGNTVTGRDIKGQGMTYGQGVYFKY